MVRATLDDHKTQTRRVINTGGIPADEFAASLWLVKGKCPYGGKGDILWVRETWKPDETPDEGHDEIGDAVGDHAPGIAGIQYRADDAFVQIENTEEAALRWHKLLRPEETWPELRPPKWRPSIHMPRWVCRLVLDVKSVRVERVQDITETDAAAEGMPDDRPCEWLPCPSCRGDGVHGALGPNLGVMEVDCYDCDTNLKAFQIFWGSLNDKRGYGWDANPWVWVIEFERATDQTGELR